MSTLDLFVDSKEFAPEDMPQVMQIEEGTVAQPMVGSTLDLFGKIDKTKSGSTLGIFMQEQTPEPVHTPDVSEIAYQIQPESLREKEIGGKPLQGMSMTQVLTPGAEEYDVTKPGPFMSEENKVGFMHSLNRIWNMAKNPYDVVKGTAEFLSMVPGFVAGLGSAITTIPVEIGKRVIADKSFTIEDLYNSSAKTMEQVMGMWNEGVTGPLGKLLEAPRTGGIRLAEKITGAEPQEIPEGDPELIADIWMAPYNAVAQPLHALANSDTYKDYPNARGIIKFSADALGLALMGRIHRGGKGGFEAEVEPIIQKATELDKAQKEVSGIPIDTIRAAQQKVLDAQKVQLELEAQEVQKNLDFGKLIAEDLSSKTEQIKQIKAPKKEIVDEAVNTAYEKATKKVKGKVRKKIERTETVTDTGLPGFDDVVKTHSTDDISSIENILKSGMAEGSISTTGTRGSPKYLARGLFGVVLDGRVIDASNSDMFSRVGGLSVPRITHGKDLKEPPHTPDGLSNEVIVDNGKPTGLVVSTEATKNEKQQIYKLGEKYNLDVFEVSDNFESTKVADAKARIEEAVTTPLQGGEVKVPPKEVTVDSLTDFYRKEFKLSKKDAKEAAQVDLEDVIPIYEKATGKKVSTLDEHKEMLDFWESVRKEEVSDVDLQTGTREPVELSQELNPFRDTDIEAVKAREQFYETMKVDNPESLLMREVNRVNDYLNGNKEADIATARHLLSELAARADELRYDYFANSPEYPGNFFNFKESASEAAKWARLAERKEPPSVQLNMMVPLNEIPKAVKSLLKSAGRTIYEIVEGKKTKDIAKAAYRNYEIWKETGFWLDKDGNWRYELDPSKLKLRPLPQEVKDAYFTPGLSVLEKSKQFVNLTDIMDYPELYEAVPQLKDFKVQFDQTLNAAGTFVAPNIILVRRMGDKSSLRHELQHGIEDAIGTNFKGTNPRFQEAKILDDMFERLYKLDISEDMKEQIDIVHNALLDNPRVTDKTESIVSAIRNKLRKSPNDYWKADDLLNETLQKSARKNYMTDPGEMLARLTEVRAKMSPEQRKTIPPWETLDKMLEGEYLKDPAGFERYSQYQDPGQKLFSIGGATVEGAKQLIEMAKKLPAYTRKARGMKSFKPLTATKMVKDELNRSFVDRSGNIRRELLDSLGDYGYEVLQKMYLAKGASSLAAQQLKQMRKEVYGGLSRHEKQVLDNLILADRMIDIGSYKTSKQFNFPEGLDPVSSSAYNELFQYIEKLSDKQASELKTRARAYFEWMKKPLQDMLEAGLITQEEFDNLSSHNYRRIKLVDIYDKRYEAKVGKHKRTVYDSGVEALARGRGTDIFEPSSEIMALEVFNRAYGRILNNRANQGLLEVAKAHPENEFVRVKEKKGDKIPSGWNRIFMYEGGERKTLYISPEMSKEWITSNPEMSYKMSQLLRWASGSVVLRTFATGINWGFALANLPRDVMHTWFAARAFENGKWKPIYNPALPVFAMQMGRDLASVFTDAALRKGRYEDYIREGGGMEFLVHQGRLLQKGRHLEGPIDKVYNFMGYFGETSEILTRLAIRERAMRKGKSSQGATFVARDYMDFGQGGGLAKALDNAFPYLNAAIQGTRGMMRSFKPGEGSALSSTFKLAQFGALVTGLYVAMQKMHPESSEALKGNIDMQNNLCIPLGDQFAFEDERGQIRYPYVKIPLDPGQKFFKTFFEASADKWLGRPVDVDRVTDSLKEMSPVGVTELPPTVSGALGYVTNKDFWLNEDIWKETDKTFSWPQSQEEYLPGRTPQVYKDFGKATGMSPERTRYAVEELVTSGTMWSWLLGQGYEAAFGDMPESQKEKHLAMTLARTPVVKRFFGVTNPYSQHAAVIDKAEEESVVKRWMQNRELDTLAEGYLFDKTVTMREIEKFADSFDDVKVYDRLMDRFEFAEATKDLPNRSFWMRLKGLNLDARARVYVEEMKNASPERRRQIESEVDEVMSVGGVLTNEFWNEVDKIEVR